jgi:lysozyme C
MAKVKLLFLAIFCLTIEQNSAKIFSKCELARDMFYYNFPKADLPDWMCLVKHESSFNSGVKGGPNSDGSYDYGIFQINSRYWCRPGKRGGECNIECESKLN